jgi:hypothetical protein
MSSSSIIIIGHQALEIARHTGRQINKFADPTDGAAEDIDLDEAEEVAAEDVSLIWLDLDDVFPVDRISGSWGGVAHSTAANTACAMFLDWISAGDLDEHQDTSAEDMLREMIGAEWWPPACCDVDDFEAGLEMALAEAANEDE